MNCQGFIKSGDAEIFYKSIGEDNCSVPLVLLHGNGEDSEVFAPQISFFAKTRRVIAIDTRGHGKSTRGGQPLGFYIFAKDTCHVLRTLGIDKADILGFSDGANIAIHLALRYPEIINKLILVGGNLYPSGMTGAVHAGVLATYCCQRAASIFSDEQKKAAEITALMTKHPKLSPGELAAITASTLVMAGERDMIKPGHTKIIADAIKGSTLQIIKAADHFLLFKQPKSVNILIERFLQEHTEE